MNTPKKILDFGSRKFLSMLSSATLNMFITIVMMLSDAFVAGYFFNEKGSAAVNLVLPVFSFVAAFATLLAKGTIAKFTYENGTFNNKCANKFFTQGAIIASMSGLFLAFCVFFGKDIYFSILNPEANLLALAESYYAPYTLIVLFYPLSLLLTGIIYADGDELIPYLCYGVQIVGNVICSIILCMKIGIIGVAIGTLISTFFSIIVSLIHFARKNNTMKFIWHLSFGDFIEVCRFGVTGGAQYFFLSILVYVLNVFVNKTFGGDYLPVVTVVIGLVQCGIIFDGIGQAFVPIVNVYIAEKCNGAVRKVMKTAFVVSIIEGLIASSLVIIFRNEIPMLYGVRGGFMHDAFNVAILIMGTTLTFSSLQFLTSAYYILIGQIEISILITFINYLACPLLFGIPSGLIWGPSGLWISIAIAPIISTGIALICIYFKYGKERFPLLLDHEFDKSATIFDIVLNEKSIVTLRDEVSEFLKSKKVNEKTLTKVLLTIEECALLIYKKNTLNKKGKKIYMQCAITCEDNVRVIFRDSGEIFELTDSDVMPNSMNSYVVGIIMTKLTGKRNQITTGYNRNDFVFENAF